MTSVLIALVLTTVQPSTDGRRIVLAFDDPVTFSQTFSISPPRVEITIPDAQAADQASAEALRAGLTVLDGGESPLRIVLPLPDRTRATVSSTGLAITIELEEEPLLLARAGPKPAAAGGHPAPSGRFFDADGETLIGPEDLLEVNVFELPELKTTTRVLGDGTVSLPLVGVVQAAGLSKLAFETRLRDLLEDRFLLDPQVTVTVTEHRSTRVSIIGAVTKPGPYQMIGPRNLLQMLSEAGGLTKEAGTDIVVLRRGESDVAERIVIDLEELVVHGNPELNITMLPGDVVNVPVDQPIYVFVDGAVNKPGQVDSTRSRPITLLQAIARAGGLSERANLKGVHVLRKGPDGTQTRIAVNLRDIRKGKDDDIPLEDGDVIVVPETFF